MPNPMKRMTANPVRPGRYRPGKAVAEAESSDEDDEEVEQEVAKTQKVVPHRTLHPTVQKVSQPTENSDDDEEGFETEEHDDETAGGVALPNSGAELTETKAAVAAAPLPTEQKDIVSLQSEEGSLETDRSSEEESDSSEDDVPQRKFQRPTFIKKSNREGTKTGVDPREESATPIVASTSGIRYEGDAEEVRRRQEITDQMLKDKLEQDAAARLARKTEWDDDGDVVEEDMVDDTDGLDPEAELAAWKLRELKRLMRTREEIERREKEIEERERRQNLSQAEREAEDAEYLSKQKEEREDGRGQAGFMQRYHHKGAFFQDEEVAAELRKRDLVGARFEDQVDRENLPQYMQIRDMTKLGRKGRTRYTDLKGQDTGRFGNYNSRGPKFGGPDSRTGESFDTRGLDARFQPDHDASSRSGPTGANASDIGVRRDRAPEDAPRGPRDHREDSYRPSRDYGDDSDYRSTRRGPSPKRRRSYSRSRSPFEHHYRDEDGRSGRKRSPSTSQDRDKRRRIEVH